jgi:hypothetical protein
LKAIGAICKYYETAVVGSTVGVLKARSAIIDGLAGADSATEATGTEEIAP